MDGRLMSGPTDLRLGFLHTVPALAGRFDADLRAAEPGATAVHVVDGELLATAIRSGVDDAVDAAVARHVEALAAEGVAAILVTCSSIGESAELAAAAVGVPVVRVDAAMAADAVARALGPTGRLLERSATALERPPVVTTSVVAGAGEARAAGDDARADELIAEAVRAAAAEADVVVLAQASMAAAAELAGVDVPALSSPASGLAAAIAVAR
jgi:phosphoheptose isomerase